MTAQFTHQKQLLQSIAAFKAFGIHNAVVSPGSRNAPLIQCLYAEASIRLHFVLDERAAAYFAIGLQHKSGQPVLLCCTSGTALLNYAPALAEALYQEIPLVVFSADRPARWIDQLDGQTIQQHNSLAPWVKQSIQLPESESTEALWHANLLLNESLNRCTQQPAGPIHINVPLSEPLIDQAVSDLPEFRRIRSHRFSDSDIQLPTDCLNRWNQSDKRLLLVGQLVDAQQAQKIRRICNELPGVACVAEHLSGLETNKSLYQIDSILQHMETEDRKRLQPEIVVSMGGHILSKTLKQYLRESPHLTHWHVDPSGRMPDTYNHLTEVFCHRPEAFLRSLLQQQAQSNAKQLDYAAQWQQQAERLLPPDLNLEFSDRTVAAAWLRSMPENSHIFVGNSSPIRNIHQQALPKGVRLFVNRGTNGIEGSIATAAGYATLHEACVYVLMGDLSFFHDLGSLSMRDLPDNLHITVINNGGGGIFHQLEALKPLQAFADYVAAEHRLTAEKWAKAAGFHYTSASDAPSLHAALASIPTGSGRRLIEIFSKHTLQKNNTQ